MTSSQLRPRIRIGPEVANYPPGATFGPRVLIDYEFVWLLRGGARWRCDSGAQAGTGARRQRTPSTSLDLLPGALLLVRPGMADRFEWSAAEPTTHAFVHFRLASPGPLRDPQTWPVVRDLSAADPMAALCRYLVWLGGLGTTQAAERSEEVVSWLLDLFVRGPVAADEADQRLPDHFDRLVAHLRSSWQDGTRAVPLGEMADAAGVSRGHLCRLFRERFGLGPVAAIELIRLSRAATLLQRSNLTVGLVAATSGFVSPFHFSRRFRVVYGMAPRAYRSTRPVLDPLTPVTQAHLLPLAHRLLFEHQ